MDEFPCPNEEQLRRVTEIRRRTKHFTFLLSWPSAAINSLVMALAVVIVLIAQMVGVATFTFYIVLSWIIVLTPIAGIVRQTNRKFLGMSGVPRRSASFPGEGLPGWEYPAAVVAALLLAYFVAGRDLTGLVLATLWFWMGITAVVNGWLGGRWYQISYGILDFAFGIIFVRSFATNNFGDFFVLTLLFFAIVEAGLAYWAWQAWQKEAARLKTLFAGQLEQVDVTGSEN